MCGAASTSASPLATRQRTVPSRPTSASSSNVVTTSSTIASIPPPSVAVLSSYVPSITIASSIPPTSLTSSVSTPLFNINPLDFQISPDTFDWMKIFNLTPQSPTSPSILDTTLQFPIVYFTRDQSKVNF
ncbi:hypothetical protein O6H91_04G037200 [Diphasiastrum complanatum]|uniref:Uncharacterized protein n=1 Tax=Diphasiastrum complanatum TaxID=34168 RepID=A0ACC2DVN9_DIPCM|nr:hypothetical protein O6H91_04G037200 [Diphasiastrum complanatum]